MRILEIVTLGTLFPALAARFWPAEKRPYWTKTLPATAILLILVHLVRRGYRWQMVPAYALAASLFVMSVPRLLGKRLDVPAGRGRRILNRLGMILGLAVFVIAAALPALFPVFKLPNPTGPYAVGTTSFVFSDDSRPEIFTSDPADKRSVYVQAWYPAGSTADSTRAPMWIHPEKVIAPLAKDFFMPEFAFSHLASVQSNSYVDAPLPEPETTYPVLVFSHGYDVGFFAQNMVQMEELASHGYVVLSIGHAYESSLVLDAQGRAIGMSEPRVEAFSQEIAQAHPASPKIHSTTGNHGQIPVYLTDDASVSA